MKAFLCFIVLFLSIFLLRAEPPEPKPRVLGMTEDQLRLRYGNGELGVRENPAEKVLLFRKNGVRIFAYMLRGHAEMLIYSRENGQPFIRYDAEVILALNGARWIERDATPDMKWLAADATAVATNYGGISKLLIVSKDYMEAMKRAAIESVSGL